MESDFLKESWRETSHVLLVLAVLLTLFPGTTAIGLVLLVGLGVLSIARIVARLTGKMKK